MIDTDERSEAAIGTRVVGVSASTASKDQLVLAMLAVLGGERDEVNERDLFLACWHAFTNAMRWANTSLPNPDTFTAALRRLDAHSLIKRSGKTQRTGGSARLRPGGPRPSRPGALAWSRRRWRQEHWRRRASGRS